MGQFAYTITDEIGLHARPAGALVKLVKESDGAVTISKGEKSADASRLMAIMGLGIRKGDEVVIATDDEALLEKLRKFFQDNL
ncbi:MAG: HPr family phosphocarrier protein [Lachnospiraceae bacterium]|nr:HPr family phosphocarrier protein [Lachnospiraceae bacterium]